MSYITTKKFCEIYLDNLDNAVVHKAICTGKSDLPPLKKIGNTNHFCMNEIMDWFAQQGGKDAAKRKIMDLRVYYERYRADKTGVPLIQKSPQPTKNPKESVNLGWRGMSCGDRRQLNAKISSGECSVFAAWGQEA